MEAPPATDAAVLAKIWDQYAPMMAERVELLDRAAAALATGVLEPGLRDEADQAAHQLAGSVGAFGYPTAGEAARAAELLLRSAIPSAERLAELVGELRDTLDLPPATEAPPPQPDLLVSPARPAAGRPTSLPVVLVVAAEAHGRDRLAAEAARVGLGCTTAASVDEAMGVIVTERPDVAVLELAPNVDVDRALGTLAMADASLPVLILAPADDLGARLAAARRGAAGFVVASASPAAIIDQAALACDRVRAPGARALALTERPEAFAALGAGGVETTAVTRLETFWDELSHGDPGLVLVDLDVHGGAGADVCRVLRNDARWAAVPLVAVTHRDDLGTFEEAFAAGADDCLTLPLDEPRLLIRARAQLSRFAVQRTLADVDPLTGVASRRMSVSGLDRLLRLADRTNRPLALAEIDVDHFKRVNEEHGHQVGDAALRRLADLLLRSFRGEDVVARWGGEEFVVGMLGLDRSGGVDRVNDVLAEFRSVQLLSPAGMVPLSFSAGVAQYPDDGTTLEALYAAADHALYAAKTAGRNQVTGAGSGGAAQQVADVVIIEDDDAAAAVVSYALKARGLRWWRFSNGAGAAAMLCGRTPQLRARVILLDIDMPAVDGFELLTMLARDGITASSQVLMLTASRSPEDERRARGMGAAGFLVKPVAPVHLQRHIDDALGRA